jgi:hypothetical protein
MLKDKADQFASLMDENRYEEAAALLAENCSYKIRETRIDGRDAIIDSYVANYKKGLGKLDEIQFLSNVVQLGGNRFQLEYLDRIRKGDVWHEHRCNQIITFEGDAIADIQHVDLPGEVEALHEFYLKVGLEREAL